MDGSGMTSKLHSGLYPGTVMHGRLAPVRHAFRYRVFSCLFDLDELGMLERRLRLFSLNRFNLVSLHERDFTEGVSLKAHADRLAAQAGFGSHRLRCLMLAYPRLLGYAFNPLTVFFWLDEEGRTVLVAYQVNNTFGERMTYVIPVDDPSANTIHQQCDKRLYVSPFNPATGLRYSFHVTPPGGAELTVGVAVRQDGAPLLKTFYRGERRALDDAGLIRAVAATGWMTVKVIAGIHYEAARLWLKGLALHDRPKSADRRRIYHAAKPAPRPDDLAA